MTSELLELAARNRLANGQFAPRFCGDPNCSGELVADVEREPWGERPILRCDGLTHIDDNGPLVACRISHLRARASQGSNDHE